MPKEQVRMDLDEKSWEMLQFIMKWLNVDQKTPAIKFCIKQAYDNLREGKLSIIRD